MNDTPNLALPYILAAQAQKHVTHNEAIRALDCLVQLSVESRALTAPPATSADGGRYLVAAAATGDWAGKSDKIAAFQDGAWAFFEPREGWIAWVADEHELIIYSAGAWAPYGGGSGGEGGGGDGGGLEAPVANASLANMATGTIKGRTSAGSGHPEDLTGAQATALLDTFGASGESHKKGLVPDPGDTEGTSKFLREDGTWAVPPAGDGGGDTGDITELDDLEHVGINTTADSTNVLALKGPASLFDNSGNGHQQKINKHADTDTASVLYQTNYSGRAETGLAGDDDFHFKVSPDGATWFEAIQIDRTTGRASFPNTGSFPAYRNRVVNPQFLYAQAGVGSTADGAYTGFDQWLALTQSANVTASQLTDVVSGLPVMGRLTQANATAQRMGWLQPLEGAFVRDLRNKTVALQFQARMSVSATLRYAIVEWTGTADTITKDIVNNWTSGTFTPGNFFNSSNLTVAASGSKALTANTVAQVDLSGAISASMNNILLFIWTDSAQAQNVTLDVGNVFFGQGSSAPASFDPPAPDADLRSCKRYWQQSYAQGTAPGTATTVGGIDIKQFGASTSQILWTVPFVVTMRGAPTVTLYDSAGAAGKIFRGANGKSGYVPFASEDSFQMACTDTTNTSEFFFQFAADARL